MNFFFPPFLPVHSLSLSYPGSVKSSLRTTSARSKKTKTSAAVGSTTKEADRPTLALRRNLE